MPSLATPSPSVRFAHGGVLALTVGVFAVVVAAVTWQLGAGLREQFLRREGSTLAAIAAMQLDNGAADMGDRALAEVPGALLSAVLKTSKMRGVSGVRIFDADQRANSAWPFRWSEDVPPAADWRVVLSGESVVRLHRDQTADDLIGLPSLAPPQPALEVWVPLRRTGSPAVLGVAQFLVNGGAISGELAVHDRRLWMQAVVAWIVGSVVIVLVFSWALRRLDRANRELVARGDDLMRANRELVLAAKTSALGAVTAHLFHELKNPLAGLELIVAGSGDAGSRLDAGGEMAAASELTRRLRTMVNDVVGVLRDEQTGAKFRLTCADVAEIVSAKVQGEAAARGVRLEFEADPERTLAGRRANLVTLVLRNLLQNAIEATPAGGQVKLICRGTEAGAIEFIVEDGGAGLPEAVQAKLFQPCTSTKPGGSGLGLALSHQLAAQAGGRLELLRSGVLGTSFRLVLHAEA
ncbi:MAG: HAMP domain-containing sensor histidine kinase [Verrucomicrobiota bacterium]|jgi:signal transduction histidine kinase